LGRQKDRRRGYKPSQSLQRRSGHWPPRARVLVVCEGEQTEPRYFRALCNHKRLSTAEVEVCGPLLGTHPSCVVKYALTRRKQTPKSQPFDEVWCVFDRDDHERIHEALTRARHCGIKVAFSNPSFELWFLLHLAPYSSAERMRSEVVSRLKKYIPDYHKSMDVYYGLVPHQQVASLSAKRLRNDHQGAGRKETHNPSTSVDLLVEKLNALAETQYRP